MGNAQPAPDGRIRVLYVMRPAAGGMRQHLLNLVRGLPSDAYVIAVAGPCGPYEESPDSSLTGALQDAGATVLPIPITGRIDPILDARAISLLRRYIISFRPHIVHCHGFKAGILGRVAVFLSRGPCRPFSVYTIHNTIIERTRGTPMGVLFAALESALASRTDCVITISEALRKEYLSMKGTSQERVVCIPNGIDISRFKQASEMARRNGGLRGDCRIGRVHVGTIARLIPAKGVDVFIKAARQLLDRGMDAVFLVVGDGPQRPELEKLTQDLDIQSSVRFLGFRDDIPAILESLDLFVLPTLSEGMSITILEAMAAGVPVVASDVGGVSEVVINEMTGRLVPPGDVAALADAIERALGEPDKARAMASLARLKVEEDFNLQTMLRRTDKLYKDLMASGHAL
ncbi:MAG TPA: glycosyltransferase family 4 protein [Firmicutes bacterium]|nr:glycosyltransferase family 4 protein [Bacillota bacterium]